MTKQGKIPSTRVGRQLRARNKRDNEARALLGLSVENSQLVHIGDKKSAYESWMALKISLHKRLALLYATIPVHHENTPH